MATEERPLDDLPEFAEQAAKQTMEAVHAAMTNYFSWLRKMQSATQWGNADLNKKLLKYAEQSIDAAFTFAQRLSKAKSMQDVAQIQTDFMQAQLTWFTEQAQDLGSQIVYPLRGDKDSV
jgi:hypothetical protein